MFLIVGIQYEQLCKEKESLEIEMKAALQNLKEMNELEKQSIGVNVFQSQQQLRE